MKRMILYVVLIIALSGFGIANANPLMPCELHSIRAFPPEVGVYFNDDLDMSGVLILTMSGTAVIDSGVIGEYDELLILDSTNTSGFELDPEGDSVTLYHIQWYELDHMRYGNIAVAPPPIQGHSIGLEPYSPGYAYVWSFDFSEPDWGETDIVINEINAHGNWNEGSNFIELYNKGDSIINLEGWRVVCDTIYDLPSEAMISPGGFYPVDETNFPENFDMDSEADNIYLISEDSRLVDQVGWSSDHGENVSFMRFPDGDVDTSYWNRGCRGYNDNSSVNFENGFPSRGAPNRHESPGFVVIGARAVGSEGTVDLYWTNPIWDEMYNASVAVRNTDHFPETIDDGDIVYQGGNQHVTDTNLGPYWYYYTIFARNDGGEYSIPTDESRASVSLTGNVGIDNDILPERISYLRAYPNPFNSTTTIDFGLMKSSDITISIYNLLGQQIITINEGVKEAGDHSITWDASDFPSGVYFARLEAGERSENVKMVLLK
ncbi:MAG: lamin tail domain-containing protein [candidate division Zixibacteria bacterium]